MGTIIAVSAPDHRGKTQSITATAKFFIALSKQLGIFVNVHFFTYQGKSAGGFLPGKHSQRVLCVVEVRINGVIKTVCFISEGDDDIMINNGLDTVNALYGKLAFDVVVLACHTSGQTKNAVMTFAANNGYGNIIWTSTYLGTTPYGQKTPVLPNNTVLNDVYAINLSNLIYRLLI